MSVAPHIKELMSSSSFIRKMFEEGLMLKEQYGSENVYDFSIGNPDLEPPKKVKEVLARIASSTNRSMHAYMPNAGFKETRAAMATKVSREQGLAVDFSNIIMQVGAAGALNSIFKAILCPGSEVLVSTPYFPEYTHYARNHGGILVNVASKEDFSLDLEAISKAIGPKTTAILINSPNNPTGKIYSEEEIKSIGILLKKHKETTGTTVYLIADEPYREIVYDNRVVSPIFPFWNDSIIASSFAKNLSLPGERIGYIAINPQADNAQELTDAIIFSTRVLGFVNAPATFQRIVAECWDEPVDYSSYKKRRDALSSILEAARIPFAKPEGAFYMFCKVPEKKDGKMSEDDALFCEHLKKYRILGVPGRGFGKKGWFRLAYCVSEKTIENSKDSFLQAVQNW